MSLLENPPRSILGVNLKVVVAPIVFLLALVLLTVFVIKTGFTQVTRVREKLVESKRQQVVLTTKLETLQNGQEAFEQFSDLSVVVTPEKSPAAIVSSSLKSLAAELGVTITGMNLKTQEIPDSKLLRLASEISVKGELKQLLIFLIGLHYSLPISRIVEVTVNEEGDLATADLIRSSFYSPFPETLPTLTSPISDLSDEEKEQLNFFAKYRQPDFSQVEVGLGGPYDRADLFNF
jgi:hypothetical protein